MAVLRPRKVSDSVFRSAVGRSDDVLTRSRDEIAVGSSVAMQARNIVFLYSYLPVNMWWRSEALNLVIAGLTVQMRCQLVSTRSIGVSKPRILNLRGVVCHLLELEA